jgi:sarcosine oxidase
MKEGPMREGAMDEAKKPEAEKPGGEEAGRGLDRRSFLRATGVGAGALAAVSGVGGLLSACAPGTNGPAFRRGSGPDVVVVGAGAFGGWTAYHLQQMGARVTLVDLYGPGNSRSTSGDETRGIRTSYPGRELWTSWARRSIERWHAFDAEYAAEMGAPIFYETGDLILRDTETGFIEQVREIWDQVGVRYEALTPDEVRYRWPQIGLEGITHALYEPEAGVARSRAACQRVAHIVERRGGQIRTGRAEFGRSEGGRLLDITLNGEGGERIGGERFVFALGPWFATTFQDVFAGLIRIPMGNVVYYGTPPGDPSFDFPNLPSWNFPGVTGWPSLPPDHRGFRIRTGGRAGDDPDTSERWVPEASLAQPRALLEMRFPGIAAQPVVETRACHYESSSTRDWIIDRHPTLENVWFAGGGSAEGFKFGPTVGELIAARVIGDNRFAELDAEFRLPEPEGTVAP